MANVRRLAANIFSTMVGNLLKMVIQLLMLPVMARLLGPEELGLYALALPILTFVLILSDAGVGDSLAREKSNDSVVWSSAFWGLMSSGLVLGIIVYGVSFIIAHFAGQPRLPQVMLPLCLTLLMVAATVIPASLMLREGKMGYGAMGDLIGTAIGAALAVYMAYHGFGVWAMVSQYVTTYLIRMLIFNFLFPFVPKFEFSLSSLFGHSHMGGAIMGGRLAELAGRVFEGTQVSRQLGHAALGAFGYMNQVPRFLVDTIGNATWANLYYLGIHGNPKEMAEHYVTNNRLMALILFPTAAIIAVGLGYLIPLLLGDKWGPSIQPMTVLLLSAPLFSMGNLSGAVLFAQGRLKLTFITIIIVAIARCCVVLFAGILGLFGLALGFSTVIIIYWLFIVFVVSRYIGHRPSELMMSLVGPFTASAFAAFCLYFIMGANPDLFRLFASSVIAFIIYCATLFVIDRRRVIVDLSVLKRLIKKE